MFHGRWDWAGQNSAADGGGGAGSAAGWLGRASVLIPALGARACKPFGVAAARTIGSNREGMLLFVEVSGLGYLVLPRRERERGGAGRSHRHVTFQAVHAAEPAARLTQHPGCAGPRPHRRALAPEDATGGEGRRGGTGKRGARAWSRGAWGSEEGEGVPYGAPGGGRRARGAGPAGKGDQVGAFRGWERGARGPLGEASNMWGGGARKVKFGMCVGEESCQLLSATPTRFCWVPVSWSLERSVGGKWVAVNRGEANRVRKVWKAPLWPFVKVTQAAAPGRGRGFFFFFERLQALCKENSKLERNLSPGRASFCIVT